MRNRLTGAVAAVGLAAAIWGAPAAQARDLFVSLRGDDGNAGTREAPLRTIAKASGLAGPGDVVTLGAGTYEETIEPVRDGTEGQPIVYQGEDGVAAGAPAPVARIANVGTGAVVTDRSWITFRSLSFGNCTEQWIYGGNAHHITVQDCAFDADERVGGGQGRTHGEGRGERTGRGEARMAGGERQGRHWEGSGRAAGLPAEARSRGAGVGIYGASYLTIRRCKFGTWGGRTGHGRGDMVMGWPCDYTLVEDCDFRGARAGHSLLATHGRHIVIRGNYFENQWQKCLDIGERVFRQEHVPGSFYLIERNTFFRSTSGDPENAIGLQIYSYNSIVRNNLFVDNGSYGINANCWGDPARGGDITPGISNNRFYNNTFWGNGKDGMVMEHSRPKEKDVDGNVIVNNIFANNGDVPNRVTAQGGQLVIDLGRYDVGPEVPESVPLMHWMGGAGKTVVRGNCFWQPHGWPNLIATGKDGGHEPEWWNQTYPEQFSDNIAADPKLAAPEKGDFSLTGDSPCRGRGLDLTHAVGSGDNSVWLRVEDAGFFNDGKTIVQADGIRVGDADPVQIKSIDYRLDVLELAEPRTWQHGDPVNLYSDSTGGVLLTGAKPSIGAIR